MSTLNRSFVLSQQKVTTTSVIHPPKIVAVIVPKYLAAKPDSKAPSSLLEETNMPFTAATRPRIFSGGKICKMVCLTTTEILSHAPVIARAKRDNHILFEKANRIVNIPKPATASNMLRHAC